MRVVLADDSVLLREGLARLLAEVGCEVVAAVGDAPTLLEAVRVHRPDVAVVDIRMPPGMTDDGLRAAVAARAQQPGLAVLDAVGVRRAVVRRRAAVRRPRRASATCSRTG